MVRRPPISSRTDTLFPDTTPSRFQVEVVDTPTLDSHDVLVMVMAAGVNYNGVWAGLGVPISPFDVHKAPYHIAGSDAAGVVWAVGSQVKRSEEHTSELQSLMRISYAVFCLKKKKINVIIYNC